jgi:Transglutaminase-like superfamily
MARFSTLAGTGCPPLATLLLALAAEFRGDVDPEEADARLDALALPLFGAASVPARDAACGLARVLDSRPGFDPDPDGIGALYIDVALRERRGHPLMLAAIALETGRRAGLRVHLLAGDGGWYAALADDERYWLVDTTLSPGRRVDAAALRPHCAHEVAYAALAALGTRFERAGDSSRAGRAALLREQLPMRAREER